MQPVDESMHRMHLPSESLSVNEPDLKELGCESSPELVELSAHEFFSSALQNAQRQASMAEGPRK
jgi:hypothetical protein